MQQPMRRRIFLGTPGPARAVGVDLALTLRLTPQTPTTQPQQEPAQPPPPPPCPEPMLRWVAALGDDVAHLVRAFGDGGEWQPWDFRFDGPTDRDIELTFSPTEVMDAELWIIAAAGHAALNTAWRVESILDDQRAMYHSAIAGGTMVAIRIDAVDYSDDGPVFPHRIEVTAAVEGEDGERAIGTLVAVLVTDQSGEEDA